MQPRTSKHKMEIDVEYYRYTFLLLCLKTSHWDVRILSNSNLYQKIILLAVFLLRERRNHTKSICVFSAQWPCTLTDRMISTLSLLDALQTLNQSLVVILNLFVEFQQNIYLLSRKLGKETTLDTILIFQKRNLSENDLNEVLIDLINSQTT